MKQFSRHLPSEGSSSQKQKMNIDANQKPSTVACQPPYHWYANKLLPPEGIFQRQQFANICTQLDVVATITSTICMPNLRSAQSWARKS